MCCYLYGFIHAENYMFNAISLMRHLLGTCHGGLVQLSPKLVLPPCKTYKHHFSSYRLTKQECHAIIAKMTPWCALYIWMPWKFSGIPTAIRTVRSQRLLSKLKLLMGFCCNRSY